ncbi:MAG: NmrA family transcriptional regulator [Xanthobacteraceae bacterium]|jgi:uncharacterized protein YbjT (DUF2867 family)|nr:NmrA family transcriptional regulator [Xanthobacteraceae bacterium]
MHWPEWMSWSAEPEAALRFFQASTGNLLAAERIAGVGHHVALSVVGTDRQPDSGFFRAKTAQEDLIRASNRPYTILKSTPFFEYIPGIVEAASDGDVLRVSTASIQPIAADDVVIALRDVALGGPQNREIEVVGPDRFHLNELAEQILAANSDPRAVIAGGRIGLGYLGSQPAQGGYVIASQVLTALYFGYLIVLFFVGYFERAKPRPNSIAEAILSDGKRHAPRRISGRERQVSKRA